MEMYMLNMYDYYNKLQEQSNQIDDIERQKG